MDTSHNVRSLARSCCNALEAIVHSQDYTEDVRVWAEGERKRFKLFSDVLGVFAKGKLSIEHRLRLNVSTSRAIVQLLDAIAQNTALHERVDLTPQVLRSAESARSASSAGVAASHGLFGNRGSSIQEDRISPQAAASTDRSFLRIDRQRQLSLARHRVTKDIGTLIALAALIKSQSVAQHELRDGGSKPRGPEDDKIRKTLEEPIEKRVDQELDAPGYQIVLPQFLKQRLRDTVIQRWDRIRHWNDRANKFLAENMSTSSEESLEHPSPQVVSVGKTDKPLALNVKSDSKPSTKATTLPSSFDPDARLRSQAARTTSLIHTGESDLDMPQPRGVQRIEGIAEFMCPLCRLPQRYKAIPNAFKRAWENHVLQDLAPYVCLFEDCPHPHSLYRSLQEWRDHVNTSHAKPTWCCQQCDDHSGFDSTDTFWKHLETVHRSKLSAQEKVFVTSISYNSTYEFRYCPFCGSEDCKKEPRNKKSRAKLGSQERLVRGIGRHMNEIALLSIPDDVDLVWQGSEAGAIVESNDSAVDSETTNDDGPFRSLQREAPAPASSGSVVYSWRESATAVPNPNEHPPTPPEETFWRDRDTLLPALEDAITSAAFGAQNQGEGVTDEQTSTALGKEEPVQTPTPRGAVNIPAGAAQVERSSNRTPVEQVSTKPRSNLRVESTERGLLPAIQPDGSEVGPQEMLTAGNIRAYNQAARAPARPSREQGQSLSDSNRSPTQARESASTTIESSGRVTTHSFTNEISSYRLPQRVLERYLAGKPILPSRIQARGDKYVFTAERNLSRVEMQEIEQLRGAQERSSQVDSSGQTTSASQARQTQTSPPIHPSNPTRRGAVLPQISTAASYGSPASAGNLGYGSSQSRRSSSARVTVMDRDTRLQLTWEVVPIDSPRSPALSPGAGAGPSHLSIKRITNADQKGSGVSRTGSAIRSPEPGDYRPGRVIDVLLVTPSLDQISDISPITPTHSPSRRGSNLRRRRFVISRSIENQASFEALPIRTYRGLGVAAPGVQKSAHTIIYTGRTAPMPSRQEFPKRLADGTMERPMQAMTIGVDMFDRTDLLDPMSRLNFTDKYEFHYDVPNIRLLGRIREEDMGAFYITYRSIWNDSAGRPTAFQSSFTPSGGVSSQPRGRAPSYPATSGSDIRRDTDTSVVPPGAPGPGVVTVDEVRSMIRRLQDYARARNKRTPADLTETQLQSLARDTYARQVYFNRVKNILDDTDDDDDDDDDEDNDDGSSEESDQDSDLEKRRPSILSTQSAHPTITSSGPSPHSGQQPQVTQAAPLRERQPQNTQNITSTSRATATAAQIPDQSGMTGSQPQATQQQDKQYPAGQGHRTTSTGQAIWDYRTKQYVWWSPTRRNWIDQRGDIVTAPQATSQQTAQPQRTAPIPIVSQSSYRPTTTSQQTAQPQRPTPIPTISQSGYTWEFDSTSRQYVRWNPLTRTYVNERGESVRTGRGPPAARRRDSDEDDDSDDE